MLNAWQRRQLARGLSDLFDYNATFCTLDCCGFDALDLSLSAIERWKGSSSAKLVSDTSKEIIDLLSDRGGDKEPVILQDYKDRWWIQTTGEEVESNLTPLLAALSDETT